MKQAIILTLLFSFATASFGQQAVQKQPLTKNDYLQKSKNQKETGRVLLIGGTALVIAGIVTPKGELVKEGFFYGTDRYANDGVKWGLILAGVTTDLASIPFFIASKKNRKKQMLLPLLLKWKRRQYCNRL